MIESDIAEIKKLVEDLKDSLNLSIDRIESKIDMAKFSLSIDGSHQLIKQNAKIHEAKLDRLLEIQASNQAKIEALSKVLQETKKPNWNWDKFWSTADIVLPTIIGFGVGVIFLLLISYK